MSLASSNLDLFKVLNLLSCCRFSKISYCFFPDFFPIPSVRSSLTKACLMVGSDIYFRRLNVRRLSFNFERQQRDEVSVL